jgi:BT1 family
MAQKLVRSHDESDRKVVQPLLHHHDGLSSAGVESNAPLDQRDNSNVDDLVNVHACDTGEHRPVDSDASTLAKRPYIMYHYYFCHGMQQELPSTALYLVLKKSFQMQPADYSFVLCLSWLPWVLKPVVGYLSDARPIAGRRRTPYVVIGIVLNQLGSLLLSEYALIRSKQTFLVIMLFNSLARVVSETAVDSLMAEVARCEPDDQVGRLQSTIWTFDAAGTVVGSIIPIIVFGVELEPRVVLLINASIVTVQAIMLPFLPQSGPTERHSGPSLAIFGGLRKFLVSHLELVKAVAFAFLVSATPTSGDAFEYFQTDVLKFGATFLSWTTVIQTFSNWVAAGAFTMRMRSWNVRSVFRMAILVTATASLLNILVVKRWTLVVGIPDKLFVAGGTVVQGLAGEIAFLPVAVLAARLAPAGREGTAYAVVMAAVNVAWAGSELISGLLTRSMGIADGNYANMSSLLLIVTGVSLLPLLFVGFVPEISGGNDHGGPERHVTVDDDDDEFVSSNCQVEDPTEAPTHQELKQSTEQGAEPLTAQPTNAEHRP